jgi:hypothetical protein
MLHKLEASANRKIMKFAGAAVAAVVLAGCAITLRTLSTSRQVGRDGHVACTIDSKCPNGTRDRQAAYHRSQPDDGKIDHDDPPDLILNGNQDGTLR